MPEADFLQDGRLRRLQRERKRNPEGDELRRYAVSKVQCLYNIQIFYSKSGKSRYIQVNMIQSHLLQN